MKRDMNQLNLRNAFHDMPEDCRNALMHAANSIEEDVPVKKVTFRAVLIAALIIVTTTAVALAAGSLMGWNDFYKNYSTNVTVPQASLVEMQKQQGFTCQLGPLTFETKDLITDGHTAMSSIHIRVTDGSPALLTGDPEATVGSLGESGEALAKRLGISPDMTWMEAAKKLNLPLYNVRAILDLYHEFLKGDEFEDPMWNEDNSLVYFSSAALHSDKIGDELETSFYLYAAEIDTETGAEKIVWRNRDQKLMLKVCPVLEAKTYTPVERVEFEGYELETVQAKRYVTGAYLTLSFAPVHPDLRESVFQLYSLEVLDEAGATMPEGMRMSGGIEVKIQREIMLGIEELPDTLTLSNGAVLKAK